jgi:Tol biopolymer transport system component/DNA-binding winged helix-turn-helix (wHTH) protein
VDATAGQLLRSGTRIRLSGQPFQILLILLAHPGDVVTSGQLRDQIWQEGTFVDFEHGLHAAVNKLRRGLGDSAENPRYIETVPGRGYRFIGALERPVSLPGPSADEPGIGREQPTRGIGFRWWISIAAACLAVSFALGWRFHNIPATPSRWNLARLTSDAGLSGSPALSPDGKLVAYSSDRRLDGAEDLYIQQVAGGQPIRLTSDGAGNTTPDFSPDGSRIVFRSNRNGGGIYQIPAFGGEARLLAPDGLNPRFSPDGSQVAYWIGAENVSGMVPGSGTVWVVPAAGGKPRRVGPNFSAARNPIWSPDGTKLLFVGYTSAKAGESSGFDWWLISPNGGEAVKTGASDVLLPAGLQTRSIAVAFTQVSLGRPGCWSAANTVVLNAVTGDTQNLWEIDISPRTGKAKGPLRKLTTGTGSDVDPSCASAGALAFTSAETKRDVWLLPFELDLGRPRGALERITQGPAFREHASLSNDGRAVAFASDQSGRLNIWTRDLATGKESIVAGSSFLQRYPVISASGDRVAFSAYEKDKRVIYVSSPGGTPEKLCEGCLRATDWSRDEKTLLVFGGAPYQIDVLDIASHRQVPLLKHHDYNLLYGRFSPDDRWVSFTARTQPNRARIVIAPVDGPKPIPESSWITIAKEGEGAEDWAGWSPDGKTLYFTSGTDGHTCLWGQRIDATAHQPVGGAFAVQHLHGRLSYQQGGWSAAGGRIAMVLREDTGNIWMMSRAGAR